MDRDRESLHAALADAVAMRRIDLVQVLLNSGANIKSVPLLEVLLTWEPTMIRLFLNQGADAITDAPFASAFGEKVRTALRPFLEHKAAHPEMHPSFKSSWIVHSAISAARGI